ncbi:group III truncated hemoglobin [Flavobacterium sp. SUN046]|uniref:group III truncated hemoglobin n=1 Tax=Flavobacterium sp. SUN046 TaxID=3002440 RepID=UPI002DB97080|nr:group III truncated hemoglobin [Flavobacterium sp. SUN046]MEC4049691.1 group III truncated hemoglobin [Flavobacterium sp. SUN046]
MNDVQTQEDIYKIVDSFYKKLFADERISYIFTEVMPIHLKLEEHLQMLVKFWSQSILGTGGYVNNLTQIHLDVDLKSHLTKELFEIWLHHFENAINEQYQGINCERMKNQAHNLSIIMQIKITQQNSK